jgi:hypothetical protein
MSNQEGLMSTEGVCGAKSLWKVKTGIATGAIALAVALVPAGAQGETVTPHVVTPHVVTPHVVTPHVVTPHVVTPHVVSAPAAVDPAPSPAPTLSPASSPESAPSPEPALVVSPSAAENPLPATSPSPAPDPPGGQPSAPGGPTASEDCPPWRVCIPEDPDPWKSYPDSVPYFVFTRLICPYWKALQSGLHDELENLQDAGSGSSSQAGDINSAMANALVQVRRYCITSVIP